MCCDDILRLASTLEVRRSMATTNKWGCPLWVSSALPGAAMQRCGGGGPGGEGPFQSTYYALVIRHGEFPDENSSRSECYAARREDNDVGASVMTTTTTRNDRTGLKET